MNIVLINDCRDENAKGRLVARTSSLFSCPVSFIGINSELEAAGNLIDALDAFDNRPGVILVNVAPRGGKGKNFSNGTPFGYFWYKNVLVVSTVDGLCLSLVKKLNLTRAVNLIDLKKSLPFLTKSGLVDEKDVDRVANTQFRSLEFAPKAAKYLFDKGELPVKVVPIEEIENAPITIWWIDNFGNTKTTLTTYFLAGNKDRPLTYKTNIGNFKYYDRLKDVPDGETAIITGSSGIGNKRFLEIVVQGKSAEKVLNLKVGDEVKL
jgi:hypothetical protein